MSDGEDSDLRKARSATVTSNAAGVHNIRNEASEIEQLSRALRATPVPGELSSEVTEDGGHSNDTGNASRRDRSSICTNTHDAAGTPPRLTPSIEASSLNTPPVTPFSQTLRSRVLTTSNTPSSMSRRRDRLALDLEDCIARGSPKRQRVTQYQNDEEIQFVRQASVARSTRRTSISVHVESIAARRTATENETGTTRDTPISLDDD